MNKIYILFVIACLGLCCCNQKTVEAKSFETKDNIITERIKAPDFIADSAYLYTQNQLDFGYRIPNTKAHGECAKYLANELYRFGADTILQRGKVTAYDGSTLNIINVIGSFAPEKERRILLFAHWDSRPYADNDPDKSNHRKPVTGADDGAASVAVLLEIARQIGMQPTNVGVDFIFFDAEDYGAPYFYEEVQKVEHDWALGSQYWAKHPHTLAYRAEYGILLDMVSGKGSVFPYEQVSMHFAPEVVGKIWNEAERLGYGSSFPKKQGGAIVDDHYYINLYGIPCVDIIAYHPNTGTGFPPYWHTLKDDMRNIDKDKMKAVGQTVMSVIYNE